MVVTDAILLDMARNSNLPYEYLESILRGGYFDDVKEEDLQRHLALIELSYEGQTLGLWK